MQKCPNCNNDVKRLYKEIVYGTTIKLCKKCQNFKNMVHNKDSARMKKDPKHLAKFEVSKEQRELNKKMFKSMPRMEDSSALRSKDDVSGFFTGQRERAFVGSDGSARMQNKRSDKISSTFNGKLGIGNWHIVSDNGFEVVAEKNQQKVA